ncbi:MAG TPA: hypothetical protein VD966_12605 [Pyrinomonadaceae bacterium]|nr:hypothetical protein [Pyrinomonadaceae bacterium]
MEIVGWRSSAAFKPGRGEARASRTMSEADALAVNGRIETADG